MLSGGYLTALLLAGSRGESSEVIGDYMAKLTRVQDLLVTIKSKLAGTIERLLEDKLSETVSVLDYGAKGGWNPATQTGPDDSAAFIAACKLLPGELSRDVYVPAGNYLVMNAQLDSGVSIRGAGGVSSSLFQKEGIDGNVAILGTNFNDGGSSSFADNTSNVVIRDLRLVRTNRTTYGSAADPWQQYHLIYLSAVTNCKVIDCTIEGFNGDGIYIGGGRGASIERHNLDIEIRGCYFNGIDNQNRNGISVIDCEGLLIIGNIFRRVSNQYQPGAIDVEPNANTFHRLLDIKVIANRFVQCGGGAGAAGLILQFPDVAYTTIPSGFLFAFNEVDGVTSSSVGFVFTHNGDASAARNHNVRVIGNKIRRVSRPFSVMGFTNVLIDDNQFDSSVLGALIGFTGSRKCRNIRFTNNYVNMAGTTEGRGIGIYSVDGLTIRGNRFVNVGKSDGSLGQVLFFNAGVSTNVVHEDNVYENLGNTTFPVFQQGHTFTPADNVNRGNIYLNCNGNAMQAVQSDETEQSWTPVIFGNNSAGTGSYSKQLGRYTRRGKWVDFRLEVTTTAHDGSGIVTVSLPTLADTTVAINTVVSAKVSGAGVSNVGHCVGLIYNVTAPGGGTAACRLNAPAVDAAVNFASGGVMTISLSGSYKIP